MFVDNSVRMFTQDLKKRVLGSNLVDLLTRPHGVHRYAELLSPTWTVGDAAGKEKEDVRRMALGSDDVVLALNGFSNAVKAGRSVNLTGYSDLLGVTDRHRLVAAASSRAG
jgi:stearoyl-CoA 9-desaturase NADPH oxidoreductase